MAYLGNAPARSFISFERQVFTIVNSQTAYALSHSVANENDIRLVVNNVVQEPGSGKAYTATGTALTLSAALTNGTDEMYCVFLGRATATSAPGAGSIGTAQLASDAVTTAKILDLNVTSGKIADDAVTLAKMAPGTDGNLITYDASGNPAAVATGSAGQILTSAGAGAPPTFAAAAAAGITGADLWRINSSFSGTEDPITSNWERADEATFGKIGTGMSLDASNGRFTFPSTGIWLVRFIRNVYVNNGDDRAPKAEIDISSDSGSNFIKVSSSWGFVKATSSSFTHNSMLASAFVDVTNASNFRARFVAESINSNTATYGDGNANFTWVEFIRLGDT